MISVVDFRLKISQSASCTHYIGFEFELWFEKYELIQNSSS